MTQKSPEKSARPDDLPPFDVDAARRRMFEALLIGAPPSFVDVMADLGLDIDQDRLIREVFVAYEAAAIMDASIDDFRPKAMAEVLVEAEHIERSLAAARAALARRGQAEIGTTRIEDFVRRYGGFGEAYTRRDLHKTVADLEAEKAFFDEARATLDGRGAARSRMRLFANELAPRFFELCPLILCSGPAFEQYLRAAVELMTNSCPDGRLIRAVPKDIAAER